ncbi:MAG: LysR family transcriptional regulator [Gammaproteobacteria bacterium]
MDIRQLKHFVAVAETLHFGRAAEQLHMTQPPLSQSIMALEKELGAPLFIRTKRSVALTPFGTQWLVHVRSALQSVRDLPDIARRLIDGSAGQLDLSFVSTADYSILPTLVKNYRQRYPDVELVLTEATGDVQINALQQGKGDVGIIISPPNANVPDGLSYRSLLTEPLIAAVPETWIAENRLRISDGKLQRSSVTRQPLIVFPRHLAPAFYDLVMSYYTLAVRHPEVVQQAIQMQTIISLVAAGLGMALVPSSLRRLARSGVRYVELQEHSPLLETGLVWREKNMSPTLERFLNMTAEIIDWE